MWTLSAPYLGASRLNRGSGTAPIEIIVMIGENGGIVAGGRPNASLPPLASAVFDRIRS